MTAPDRPRVQHFKRKLVTVAVRNCCLFMLLGCLSVGCQPVVAPSSVPKAATAPASTHAPLGEYGFD
ncbi:MAG: hypothetical protein QM811_10305 [Pirellulales bacterium]